MLNELIIVERGMAAAGLASGRSHPDVKDCAKNVSTLLVRLGEDGSVRSLQTVPPAVTPWKLSDGQHNSFPFIQPKPPLLAVADDLERREIVGRRAKDRRKALIDLAERSALDGEAFQNWPGAQLRQRVDERRICLRELTNTDAEVLPATMDRFLLATASVEASSQLLDSVVQHLIRELRVKPQDDLLTLGVGLLLGRFDKTKAKWVGNAALLFEADGYQRRVYDPLVRAQVSEILLAQSEAATTGPGLGICALRGEETILHEGNFQQPVLPVVGLTYLFEKNDQTPANKRYGRVGAAAVPVGTDTVARLADALSVLVSEERKGKTWRSLPSPTPKKNDLLLAFVDTALDAAIADTIAADDYSSEESSSEAEATANAIAVFEKRAERVIESVKGSAAADFTQTPAQIIMIRKLSEGNRKVVYAAAPTVGELWMAVTAWAEGERNVPEWLSLTVFAKGGKPQAMPPPHIAPLGMISFSKKTFQKSEAVGIPASEALRLFLDATGRPGTAAYRRAARVLRLTLSRRTAHVAGAAHAECKDLKARKSFDGREALRTATVLALLLHKLGRSKEEYMEDSAFRLGQLLAAVDKVHAGYCADVRGGSVPPSLLGNQVFAMAQGAPVRALAMLCRRWKPYSGWVRKADRELALRLTNSTKADEKSRGFAILTALRHAREAAPLAAKLAERLPACEVSDIFRAKLLLGYMAGLPKAEQEDGTTNSDEQEG